MQFVAKFWRASTLWHNFSAQHFLNASQETNIDHNRQGFPKKRPFHTPGIVNRTFENRTQSNSIRRIEFDWVRQSNEIEHQTFSEFDFRTNRIQSKKSNSIELNPSDCVRLGSETELNRTQLNGLRSIGSGKPIQASKPIKTGFSCAFLQFILITETPFINCPRHLREQNRTEHVEGDLIVRARLQFGMHGLSRLFSLKPLKTIAILDVKAAFLVAFYYTFEAYNPQRIWSHFCGISSFTKNTCDTLRVEVTRASKIWLWIFNACFTQITSSKIERSIGFDWFFFFSVSSISFDCRTQSNSIHELSSIEFDWVRLKFSSIDYAGYLRLRVANLRGSLSNFRPVGSGSKNQIAWFFVRWKAFMPK